jgi:hypothetical protein
MSNSFCLENHKFPINGEQPPACFYDINNNFFEYKISENFNNNVENDYISSILYLYQHPNSKKNFQYDKDGNKIKGDPAYLNIDNAYIPPNYIATFYSDANCENEIDKIVGNYVDFKQSQEYNVTFGELEKENQSVGCIKLERPYSWETFVNECKNSNDSSLNSEICQFYYDSFNNNNNNYNNYNTQSLLVKTAEDDPPNDQENTKVTKSVGMYVLFYSLVTLFILSMIISFIFAFTKKRKSIKKINLAEKQKKLQEAQEKINELQEAENINKENIWNKFVKIEDSDDINEILNEDF